MKILIDEAIPYIKGVLEPYAEVHYLQSRLFTRAEVADADALIVRTRTTCNSSLLEGSRIKHIATATIGFDHIDLDYCLKHNITVTTAAGCNARGVLHWFAGVMHYLSQKQGWSPKQRRLGVVGVGNVGRLIQEYATMWGFEVICCDPPRQAAEGGDFTSLEELLPQCDIVTLHTPLNATTRHLINDSTIKLMRPNATLINASRGEVVCSKALKASTLDFALDVWEREPNIDAELLQRALVSTPHVAGYSVQGKANATSIVVGDIAKHFDLPLEGWYPDVCKITPHALSWAEMSHLIESHIDIKTENLLLKNHPNQFEILRNNYNYRCEIF
ncbi:MAG: 4-phosphoerythronate dehydrogenase [Rikenellaceae bacterium]